MLILAPKAHYFHIEQAAFTALGRALGTARLIDRVRGAISFHFYFGVNPEPTGLEPATSAVTGRRSNQLS